MVKTVCRLRVRLNDIEKFKAAAREQVRAFREEPGNDFYTLNEEIGSDQKFAFIGGWDDAQAAQHHLTSGKFETFRNRMASMCLEMDDVKTVECDENSPREAGRGGLTVLMPGVTIMAEKGSDMEIYQELRC